MHCNTADAQDVQYVARAAATLALIILLFIIYYILLINLKVYVAFTK